MHVGVPFAPTRLNPGDDPTRKRQVREPQIEMPEWAEPLKGRMLDMWRRLPKQRKTTSEWVRVSMSLWLRHHGIPAWLLKEFDSTLGFPGEGPRQQRLPFEQRPVIDLRVHAPTTQPTVLQRQRLRQAFYAWGLARVPSSFY